MWCEERFYLILVIRGIFTGLLGLSPLFLYKQKTFFFLMLNLYKREDLGAFPSALNLQREKTPNGKCKKGVFEVLFQATTKRYISQNCKENTFIAFPGHMTHLSVEAGSHRHDTAGATRGSVASHNWTKVGWGILTFWIHSCSVTSRSLLSSK